MKKLPILVLLFVSLISRPAAWAEPPRIRIGVAAPLSGDLAEYGAAVRNGIELARSKSPEAFAFLAFLFEDNKFSAAEAISAVRKLRQVDRVQLVYAWGEVPLYGLAPVAARERFPLISLSIDPTPMLKNAYVVRFGNSPETLLGPLVEHLRKQGFKKFGIVKTDDPYTNTCSAAFERLLHPGESVEIIANVLQGETDFKAAALRVKAAKLDALGVYLYPGQVSSLYRQLEAIGSRPPSFGTDIFESRTEISAAGPAMEGALYPNFTMPSWFQAEYAGKFGNDAQIAYAFNAYAFAVVTAQILKDIPADAPAESFVKRYTEITGGEGGLSVKYLSTPEGDRFIDFPVTVKEIRSGGFGDVRAPNS